MRAFVFAACVPLVLSLSVIAQAHDPAGKPAPCGPGASAPPIIYDWDANEPAPAGYRRVTSMNRGLLGMGIGLLSAGWLTAIIAGSMGAKIEEDGPEEDPPVIDTIDPEDWAFMYIPVVGPFITIASVDARPSGMGLLIFDGALQVAGLAGLIVGIADRETRAVKVQFSGSGVSVSTTF